MSDAPTTIEQTKEKLAYFNGRVKIKCDAQFDKNWESFRKDVEELTRRYPHFNRLWPRISGKLYDVRHENEASIVQLMCKDEADRVITAVENLNYLLENSQS